MENRGIIHYGFGADYLSNWGMNEALREIYQNFLDYGEYDEETEELDGLKKIHVKNAWQPESLDFLRIGNSKKTGSESIGKHGEGLKMAFLILLREGYKSCIVTQKYEIYPDFYEDKEIGACFSLVYEEHGLDPSNIQFGISFTCDSQVFEAFKANVITDDDLVFTDDYWGDIVNKPKGNLYSGRLFVAHLKGLGRSYNLLPSRLPLDRDRSVPQSFDVNYGTSRINESYGKFTAEDFSHDDTMFINKVPEEVKRELKPVKIGNNIQFTYKDSTGTTQVLKNSHVTDSLKNDSFFEKAIKRLRNMLAKQLGLYDLLIAFQKKHYLDLEARKDFEVILERVGKQEKLKKEKA